MSGELILGDTNGTGSYLGSDWSSSEEDYPDSDIDHDSVQNYGSIIAPVYSQPNKEKDR